MKRLPRWAVILLSVLILVVLVALAAPYFLDANQYRGLIISAIEKETGRKATIGNIRARFLPTVGVTVENFTLSNPPGFAEGNVVSVESIRAGVGLGALLRRELQVNSVEFVRPKITLLTDERGSTNYDFTTPPKSAEKPGAKESGSAFSVATIPEISLTDVEFILGTVRGRDSRITPTVQVSHVSATVGNVSFDEKLLKQWRADADLSGIQVILEGFAGASTITSGKLELRDGALNVTDLEGELGKAAKAKGTLRVADVTKALVEFDVSTPLLDVDKLFPPGPAAASSSPPFKGKSELIAQGKLAAERIRYSGYEASNARATMKVYTDRIELSPASLAAYGGTVSGSARLDFRSAPSRMSVNLAAKNIDVDKMITAVSGKPAKVTGTGELNLRASGPTGKNLFDALTGDGDFAVRNGRVVGFNLGALQTLGKLQQILTFGQSGGNMADTSFSLLNGDLKIGGGRVASNQIHLDSSLGTADMKGSFGFDQTLNYDGRAVLSGGSSSGGSGNNPIQAIGGILGTVTKQPISHMSVPFSVRGTFEDPKIAPGKGIPMVSTSGQKEQTQDQQQPKKKSILDIFRKP
ncbi:MAG TPA: AsmA family protein [Candidatus Nitrosotenuis sp.]|nr:AsmA family protein [Candidatus Nitrosotenuis sp.]